MARRSEAETWAVLAFVLVVLTAVGGWWFFKPHDTVVSKCYDGQLWTTYWKKGRHKDKLILVDDKPVTCKE